VFIAFFIRRDPPAEFFPCVLFFDFDTNRSLFLHDGKEEAIFIKITRCLMVWWCLPEADSRIV